MKSMCDERVGGPLYFGEVAKRGVPDQHSDWHVYRVAFVRSCVAITQTYLCYAKAIVDGIAK